MENNGKNNGGLKILVVILLILLIGGIMFVVGQYLSSNNKVNLFNSETTSEEKNDGSEVDTSDVTTDEVTEEENDEILKEITEVYENAFDDMSNILISTTEGTERFAINNTLASKYFTDKAVNYINIEESNASLTSFPLSTIFNSTDQGKRPLTIVTKTDDTVIATGQIVNGNITNKEFEEASVDDDAYPLYIIFKKVDNTYKIDMFE